MPDNLFAVMAAGPDFAGGIIAVDIGTLQRGMLAAVIDHAAGEGPCLAMVMFKGGLGEFARAELAFEVKGVAALEFAPAIIRAGHDAFHGLPKVLAVFADPNIAGLRIAGDPPRVAETMRPGFRRGIGCVQKRVIARDGVWPAFRGAIDINAQYFG